MMTMATLLAAGAASALQCGSLEHAARTFDDAQFRHDRSTIDGLLAPDFQYVTRQGRLLGRNEFIDATTAPGEVFEPFVIRDHRVEALGEGGGVASGDATVRGVAGGKPIADRFRYADVFVRREGCWMVVYTQVTALPAP